MNGPVPHRIRRETAAAPAAGPAKAEAPKPEAPKPEPVVAKALSWAYRSLARLGPIGLGRTTDALRAEARTAVATRDGHRAWVIRDSLSKLDPIVALRSL